MARETCLSDDLLAYIDHLDFEATHSLDPDEQEDEEKTRRVIEIIVKNIVQSRESFVGTRLRKIETLVQDSREFVEFFLDDYFTREVLESVQGLVRRTMSLSRLEAERQPTHTTSVFLREATRTYVMGFPQASVALSRAALEQALKEVLGYQLSGTFIDFQALLKDARRWNVLDDEHLRTARMLAKHGDEVLHNKPTTEDRALRVLTDLRNLLRYVYSHSAGH